ncbi:hypothetical protein CR513_36573, partial [Mucuna pruriens]
MWHTLALSYKGTTTSKRFQDKYACTLWRPQVTTFKVSKDLKKLPMEELLGTFKVHEIELNKDEGQRKGSTSKAFKAKESCEEIFEEKGSNEDQLSFISIKIHSIWKHKGGSKWKRSSKRYNKEVKDKSQVMCYESKKLGHFKSKCPNLEKENEKEKRKPFFKKKKKDLDPCSSKEEDEEDNLCLMAKTVSENKDNEEKENELLKKENESLEEEKAKDLYKVNASEVNEQKEVINLRQSLAKFVNGSENLKKVIKYNKHPYDKTGLGYDKEKDLKDKSTTHCINCRKFGHLSYDWKDLQKGPSKPSITNNKEPNKIWYLRT